VIPARVLTRLLLASLTVVVVPQVLAQSPALPPSSTMPAVPVAGESSSEVLELVIGELIQMDVLGLTRALAGDPSIVTAEIVGPSRLQIRGISPGRSFVHAWGTGGRRTWVVRVVYEHFLPERREAPPSPEAELWERSRPLEILYGVTYENVRRGQNFEDGDRDTTNLLSHNISPSAESPIGDLSGSWTYSRANERQDVDSWWASLTDGHIGPLQRFDATVGDISTPFRPSFAVPTIGYRGGTVAYRGLVPWTATALWGESRSGVFATPTTEQPRDAFITGGGLGYYERPWSITSLYLAGYGDGRVEQASDYVADVYSELEVLPPLLLKGEAAVADEDYGIEAGSEWDTRRAHLDVTYRQIEKDFQTLTGPGGGQGELGVRMSGSLELTPRVLLGGNGDVYQTELFPNPDEPDAWNTDFSGTIDWEATMLTRLSAGGGIRRTPGLFAPSRDSNWAAGIGQRIPLRRFVPVLDVLDTSASFLHQESQSTTTPDLSFESETLTLGAVLPLRWGFTADASFDRSWLTEVDSDSRSQPQRFSAGLSHYSSLGEHVELRGRTGFERQEDTGALLSRLSGQDRAIGEAGITLRPWKSARLFTDGRVELIQFESGAEDQVEFGIFTGASVLLDTGIRLDPATSVRGVVYRDLNGDGVRQPEEAGVAGVRVVAGIANRAKTNKEGRFSFWRVAGKAVPIALDLKTLPRGYRLTTPRVHVIRPSEQGRQFLEFGVISRGEVRGRIFQDVDGDRKESAQDRGVAGVVVQIDGQSAQTDRSGWFDVRELPAGAYAVSLRLNSLPIQYVPTVPTSQKVEVQEGGVATALFPLRIRRTVQGTVFEDANASGRFDAGDAFLGGLPLCLDGRRIAKAASDGRYQFEDVGEGGHLLSLGCGVPMPNLEPLTPTDATFSVAPADPATITIDFRLQRRVELEGMVAPEEEEAINLEDIDPVMLEGLDLDELEDQSAEPVDTSERGA
jgi:hypothetical protein